MQSKIHSFFLVFICVFGLTNCASYDFRKMHIQQGNLLPPAKVSKIKVGMTKQQVVSILGSSLLRPTFSENRLDYAYTFRIGNGPMTQKHVVLKFRNNTLIDKTVS